MVSALPSLDQSIPDIYFTDAMPIGFIKYIQKYRDSETPICMVCQAVNPYRLKNGILCLNCKKTYCDSERTLPQIQAYFISLIEQSPQASKAKDNDVVISDLFNDKPNRRRRHRLINTEPASYDNVDDDISEILGCGSMDLSTPDQNYVDKLLGEQDYTEQWEDYLERTTMNAIVKIDKKSRPQNVGGLDENKDCKVQEA